MRIECRINTSLSGAVMEEAKKKAIAMTSEQALKDCNFYCKQDYGALIFSSVIHTSLENTVLGDHGVDISKIPEKQLAQAMASPGSDLEKGVLRWVMPYAEFQYTFPAAYPDKNTQACPRWCQRAENDFKDQWQAVFDRTYREEISR